MQERKVSPPDLPLPDVHYQEFGYLLSLVQGGMNFTPLTPQNIEDRTVPTYARPPARVRFLPLYCCGAAALLLFLGSSGLFCEVQ